MRFGVITFPGSNCDHDVIYALENILNCEVSEIWHKSKSLDNFTSDDCIVLPGGFSYGDYLRCGAIARFANIMPAVKEFSESGGYVLGICNGFQILCEAGLLPGQLLLNKKRRFICRHENLKVVSRKSPLTANLNQDEVLSIPIAHAEGRYYCDEDTLNTLEAQGQILFKYCEGSGIVTKRSNPNGALNNIAGICNAKMNVFGMMPHPERAVEKSLGSDDGLKIFRSLLDSVALPV
jgi:phosphoribosylformylglycinamidine synthase subunit PurQ / glutaminase